MKELRAFGRTLGNLRSLRGLSIDDCAGTTGMSAAVLRKAEEGGFSPKVLDALARFHSLDCEALREARIESDVEAESTVFLLHGSYCDFSSTDLAALERAMRAGRMLTSLSGALQETEALRRRLAFAEIAPAGPAPKDAAQQGHRLARRVRGSVGLPADPLPDARQFVEERFGVAVTVAELGSRGLQAASIIDQRRTAAAAVLAANNEWRQRTPELARVHLAHELCHLLFDPSAPGAVRVALDGGDIERPEGRRSVGRNALLESRAKGFAAELLLPMKGLRDLLGTPGRVREPGKASKLVASARSHFGTPWEIAAYHLRNMGFLADEVVTDVLARPTQRRRETKTELPGTDRLPILLRAHLRRARRAAGELGVTRDALDAIPSTGSLPGFVAAAHRAIKTARHGVGREVLTLARHELAEGRKLEATDLLVEHLDGLFRAGEFDIARDVLDALDPDELPPETIGGILMVTSHARSQLGDIRAGFVRRAFDALRSRWHLPEDAITRIRSQFA